MKPFTTLTIVVLALAGFLHLLRLLLDWQVTVDTTAIPMWFSVAGAAFAITLAALLWWENRK
jgi:hypothetical protein